MIANFLKSCYRHISHNKLFVTLNIIGLSIGITACWITYRIVDYELSTDKNYPSANRIYQLITVSQHEGLEVGMGGVTRAALPMLQNRISGVEHAVPLYYDSYTSLKITSGINKPFEKEKDLNYCYTLPAYFEVIPYTWLAGDRRTALNTPEKTVITEKRAKEYFPGLLPAEIIGRTLTYNDSIQKIVSGVVADLKLSSLTTKEFTALPVAALDNNSWSTRMSNDMLFIKIKQGADVNNVVNQVNQIYEDRERESFAKYQYKLSVSPVPIEEMHFKSNYASPIRKANKDVVTGLAAVAIFILVLAAINYINISTAQLPQRAKEIGIRKTMGSSSQQLIWRFVGETFIITLMTSILSLILSYFGMGMLKDFMPEGMGEYMNYPRMILFAISLVTALSIISGLYPAWLSSKVNTAAVLKGQPVKSIGGYSIPLRKALIVFQFLIAQVFIIAAFIVGQQLHYMLNKDLGFDKEAVITADVPYKIASDSALKNTKFVFLQRLRQNPAVISASLGDRPMDNGMASSIVYSKTAAGKIQGQLNRKYADTGYLSVYKFRLLAGRNISASDTMNEYLVNEAAVKQFGFSSPEDAIGKFLYSEQAETAFPIVGVVQDYHQFGFRDKIEPVAIIATNQKSRFNIRLRSNPQANISTTIRSIEKEWKALYPGTPFDYKFYDETIAQLMEPDTRMATLVNLATGIAILISCLGLFSLATLVSFQRSKEIGIRKVLGSTVTRIVQLLATDFIKLVVLSIIIASPIAWWIMNKWLQNFAFAVEIKWWMFAVTSAIAILIALLTVSFQSVKAAMVNPIKTLKTE